MREKDKEILRNYISPEEPFGPVDAEDIEDPRALEILFEHHNKIYKSLKQRPSTIVGRKGSGKTSYLNSVFFEGSYKYTIALDTSELLTSVINAVGTIGGPIFAKTVSKIWENILLTGLFAEIRSHLPGNSSSKKLINDYLAKIGMREAATFEDVAWNIVDIIADSKNGKTFALAADVLRKLDNVTFKLTKDSLVQELKKRKVRCVILLDSLDDLQLELSEVSKAVEGLLKYIGASNMPSSPIDVRFCLPAELYHLFEPLSSNPIKDFKRRLLLHWVASELVMVVAHRLVLFGDLYPDLVPFSVRNAIIDTKSDAQSVIECIFPEYVTCRLGVKEDSIAYVLRHTQLLPRHIIQIMNCIAEKHRKETDGVSLAGISEVAIRKGISEVESTLVQEVFRAYRSQYPLANTVCEECIPELQHKFSIGDLERVFRSHGKSAMQTDDFHEFKRLLVEIGAVGRVLDDSGTYIQAEFEYTVPNKLVSSTDDFLCFHPIFSQVFNAKTREKKPVYPYGSRIEDRDYRQTT